MHLQIGPSLIQVSLASIRESLGTQIDKGQKSHKRQAMAVDILALLSQQVLIPILVSLASCAIYDFLKGKALAQFGPKDAKKVLDGFHRVTINTNISLSDESMKALLDELSPLGLTEGDISIIYKHTIDALEHHAKLNRGDNIQFTNDQKDTKNPQQARNKTNLADTKNRSAD